MKEKTIKLLATGICICIVFPLFWEATETKTCEPTETESSLIKWKEPTETQFEVTIEPSTNETVAEPETESSETQIESEIESETEIETEITEEPLFYLSEKERYIVECIVMGEAGGEPYEGQVLVAQCILNGCLKEDVQPSKLRKMYKYSGFKTNVTESVKKAVSAVFDSGYKITDEPILYFYAPKRCKGKWHETQCFIIEVGGHRFFKEW